MPLYYACLPLYSFTVAQQVIINSQQSYLMGDLLLAVFQAFIEPIGYWISRVAVPVITLGNVRVESNIEPNKSAQKWHEVRGDINENYIISAVAGLIIGWIVLILCFVLALSFKKPF